MQGENDNENKIFTVENSLELVAGDKELLQEVIQSYVDDLPGQLQDLQKAITEGDIKQVELIAHSIRGTGATLGAVALSEAAQPVEAACLEGKTDEIPALFEAIPPAFAEYKQAVEAFDWDSLP